MSRFPTHQEAASEQPAGYVCDGCGHLARDPEQDMQKLREGNFLSCCPERKMLPVYTRPTPVAPVSPDATGKCGELVTVGYVHRGTIGLLMEGAVSKAVIVPNAGGDFNTPVMLVEQAEELLAAKDDHITWLKRQLEAAQGRARNAATNSAKFEELLAAERAEKERLAGIASEQMARAEKAEADNAALTAKLETANALVTCCCGDPVDAHNMGSGHSPVDQYHYALMQLEAKLAAAEKALEGLREKGRKVLDVLKAWEDDGDLVNSGKIVSDFRAALGGKPS